MNHNLGASVQPFKRTLPCLARGPASSNRNGTCGISDETVRRDQDLAKSKYGTRLDWKLFRLDPSLQMNPVRNGRKMQIQEEDQDHGNYRALMQRRKLAVSKEMIRILSTPKFRRLVNNHKFKVYINLNPNSSTRRSPLNTTSGGDSSFELDQLQG